MGLLPCFLRQGGYPGTGQADQASLELVASVGITSVYTPHTQPLS